MCALEQRTGGDRSAGSWPGGARVPLSPSISKPPTEAVPALAPSRWSGWKAGRIVERVAHLIRPPSQHFEFTDIHGIEWSHVKAKRAFCAVWRSLRPLLEGAEFLAAHNAKFDRGVLGCCCQESRLSAPDLPFLCTVKLARTRWQLRPTRLPDVCEFLGLPLRHHDPMSDAEACAGIVLAAMNGSLRFDERGPSQ